MGVRDDLLAIPDELLRRGNIGHVVLCFMDFLNSPRRWWAGFGNLEVAGHVWQGLGDLISISPIQASYSLSALPVTFEVAATPEMLGLALAAKSRVRDRQVIIYNQMVCMESVTIDGVDYAAGQMLGSPFSLYSGTMQRMPWSASGATQRSISIEAEGQFFRRNAAMFGMWTDADQKARYPVDRGLERTPLYANSYETKWRG